MRLLRRIADDIAFTADLPDHALPQYAILSHRWGSDEVTYNDIIQGTYKTKAGYSKIAFCTTQAARDGISHFWLDTCCIDKSNNAELSEALISMYRWYAGAHVCYVYLDAEWNTSQWWRRGWTLQELIAPSNLEFFEHGKWIGTKKSLEQQIIDMTRIPAGALRGEEYPIADRRSWQEGRQTQRPEDMVYSLLGLLDISMPVLYGEGRAKAEERLQYELEKIKGGNNFSLTFSLAQAPVEAQFVARNDELHEIRHNLITDGSRKIVVLHGLGGIGKTQLTIAYAKRYKDHYSAVLWLNATDEDTIKQSFVAAARQIIRERPSPRFTNLDLQSDDVIEEVKAWLSLPQNTRWLLVYDNDDNPKVPGNPRGLDLRKYLPEAYQGSVIITTRSSEVRLGHCIRIKKLDITPALEILKNSSGRELDADAEQLAHRLDGLPLAIATAGSFLSQSTFTFKKYLDYFDRSWTRLQKLSPTLTTYDRALYSTWQVSYDQVLHRDETAAKLLQLWAYFDNQDLWYALLSHAQADAPEWFSELIEDELAFESSMQILCDYGFAEVNATGYSIHACVHAWICSFAEAGLRNIALHCITTEIPSSEDVPGAAFLARRINKHAKRAQAYLSKFSGQPLFAAYTTLGHLYLSQSKLHDSQIMFDSAFAMRDDPEISHLQRLLLHGSLGSLYTNQGRFAEAEEKYKLALAGLRELDLQSETLPSMFNLGLLYRTQMRLPEAEQACRDVLTKLEELGQTQTAWKLYVQGMLGLILIDQGRLNEAEDLHLEAIPELEDMMGEDHERTLMACMNLGILYLLQDKKEEARVRFLRAYDGFEKNLGKKHIQTLTAMNNLGSIYATTKGSEEEGEALLNEALEGFEEIFGPEDTICLLPLRNLSILYFQTDRNDEAEKAHARVLKLGESATGINARYYSHYLTELGEWYRLQGNVPRARELMEKAYDRLIDNFGIHYWHTCNLALSLGLVYMTLGMFDKSEATLKASLEGFTNLGDQAVWKCYLNLGVLYATQQNAITAPDMLAQAMNACLQKADAAAVLKCCNSIQLTWPYLTEEPAFFAHYQGTALKGDVSLIMKQLVDAAYYANGNVGGILQAVAYMGSNEALEILLDNGFDMHGVTGIFGPALHCAANVGRTATVKLLVNKGVNVNQHAGHYGTALCSACWAGHKDIAELLSDVADINATGGDCGIPIQAAADQGHLEIVKLLLAKGAKIEGLGTGVCGSPLQAACTKNELEVVKFLVESGAEVNRKTGYHGTALHAASLFGYTDIVRYLIDHGADVNIDAGTYHFAVICAASRGHNDVIKLLLDHGADIHAVDPDYGTALQGCCETSQLETAKLLLDLGADVNKAGGKRGNPLQAAALQGEMDIIQLLLKAGADVHAEGGEFGYALQAAAFKDKLEVIKLLIEHGADVNAQGGDLYYTALECAAHAGHLDNVELLLAKGADVNAGLYTALDAAENAGHQSIIAVLVKAGAIRSDQRPAPTPAPPASSLPDRTARVS